jgi:hypothetical protein
MATPLTNTDFEGDFRKVGPDATATFDNSVSDPTEHASSENLDFAAKADDDLDEDNVETDDEDEDDDELEDDDDELDDDDAEEDNDEELEDEDDAEDLDDDDEEDEEDDV